MHEKEFQLPYDRCIEIDQEVDALLEEEKKKQQLNEHKAKLIEDSKKSRHFAIYKWLGWNLTLEYMSGQILGLLFFIPLLLLAILTDEFGLKVIDIISPSIADLIKVKMANKKYMIPTNVIDCPSVIKQKLYKMLDFDDCFIANKGGDLVLYNGYFEETTYVTYINKEIPDLDEFIDWGREYENEVKYLLSQLREGEHYSITDIITDKQVKYDGWN